MFCEWQQYYRIEPWGEIRGDISNAQGFAAVCSILATTASGKRTTIEPDQLMPKYGQIERRPDTLEEAQARWVGQKMALTIGARAGGLVAKGAK